MGPLLFFGAALLAFGALHLASGATRLGSAIRISNRRYEARVRRYASRVGATHLGSALRISGRRYESRVGATHLGSALRISGRRHAFSGRRYASRGGATHLASALRVSRRRVSRRRISRRADILGRMPAKRWVELEPLLQRAVDAAPGGGGLYGVAVLSPGGEPVGLAGELGDYEVRALAALVSRDGPPDQLRMLFGGELASCLLEHRTVFLGIAGRCVFVIAVAGDDAGGGPAAASALRDEVEQLIRDSRARLGQTWLPPMPGPSGSGSPAPVFAWPRRARDPVGSS